MYDLILFDLDGTLTDPEEGITKSVEYALESFNIFETDKDKLRKFIGPPLVDAFMEHYQMTKDDAIKALEKYRERFSKIGLYENKIFEGTVKLLETLRKNNKKIALATSKPIVFAKKIVEYFQIDKYFDIIVGAEFDGTRNDKADVIKEVLKQAGKYKSAVMVGDRKHDCIGAKKNNIPCIGVSFGFASMGELEENGAISIVDNFSELEKLLLE